MPTIMEWKCGETGRPLEGFLNNASGTLVIPDTAVVKLSAVRIDTGARVIDAQPVIVVDHATREIRYDFQDADLAVGLAGVTLDLEFAIIPTDTKPTYVPDLEENRLLLTIKKRISA